MRAVLAYSPRPAPLGIARPWIAALYLGSLALVAFSFANPIVLAGAGAAAIGAGFAAGAKDALARPLRWSLGLATMIIVVNVLVSQRGETILLRGWDLPVLGQIDVSAEALAEGCILALRIVVALLVFAVWSTCVDPDRVLRSIRPLAARSALTATLIARLVPLAAADAARLSQAGSLRGPGAAPLGRADLARRLLAGSLDRSVDIAATLELRGYGLGVRAPRAREPFRRGEAPLLLAGLAILAVTALAGLGGIAGFAAYPTLSVDAGLATLAFAAALPGLALAPFAGSRPARRGGRQGRVRRG